MACWTHAGRTVLEGILIMQGAGEPHGQPGVTFTSLWIRNRTATSPQDSGFWVFKLGLALRARPIAGSWKSSKISQSGTGIGYLT